MSVLNQWPHRVLWSFSGEETTNEDIDASCPEDCHLTIPMSTHRLRFGGKIWKLTFPTLNGLKSRERAFKI